MARECPLRDRLEVAEQALSEAKAEFKSAERAVALMEDIVTFRSTMEKDSVGDELMIRVIRHLKGSS